MGCDIHLFVERKGTGGKWEADKLSIERMYLEFEISPLNNYEINLPNNYEMFAILAGVRNYYDINPIDEPVGIPKDISETINHELKNSVATHSFSYHTLADLKDYDWNQVVNIIKYTDLESYKEWISREKKGRPESYCTATGSKIISNQEMEKIIAKNESSRCYTEVEFIETYKEASSPFYDTIIPELQRLSDEYGGDENVRIIFGFDG